MVERGTTYPWFDVGLGHVEDWHAANEGGNGQDVTQSLLGNILRTNVDSGSPYGIPPDNPFTATAGCDEIFAYGFRNPYRMSFDMGGSHRLFAGDAGQNLWEEVSVVDKGGNYGWNVKEGTHCFSTANPDESPGDCPDPVMSGVRAGDPLIDPVIEYANHHQPGGLGAVAVGGQVYRSGGPSPACGTVCLRRLEQGVRGPGRNPLRGKAAQDRPVSDAGTPGGQPGIRPARPLPARLRAGLLGREVRPRHDEQGPTGTTGKAFKLVRPSG